MEKKKDEEKQKHDRIRPATAGERAAKALLTVFDWGRDVLFTFRGVRPTAKVIAHRGLALPDTLQLRFPKILLVEDDAQAAQFFIDVIRDHYKFGQVTIFFASCFTTAWSFFTSENIQLVILDADLNDESGDGIVLTEKFICQRPGIIILANSSSKTANARMLSCGAHESINKSFAQLQSWLTANDPAGEGKS
jgi:CheY-like chemotaxis protein